MNRPRSSIRFDAAPAWSSHLVVVGLLLAAPSPVDAQFEIAAEQFDQWVFQGHTQPSQVLAQLNSQLELQIEAVHAACNLREDQKQKLRLAGSGDIKRFLDDVDRVRQKFNAVRRDQEAFNQIWQDIQPLQMRFQSGLFDDQSLVHKVVRGVLNGEQRAAYEEVEQQRRRFQYEAKVALIVSLLESSLALRGEQRERLSQLILEETDPPKAYGQYAYYVILYQASRIPAGKLQPLFDDAQWQILQNHFQQVRGLEAFLKQNGLLP